jgi:Transposase DDE domain group 1
MKMSSITTSCGTTPIMAVLAGKLTARRKNCAPVAGKSTLNRLELGTDAPTAYHKIGHDPQAIEALFVGLFLETHRRAPRQIILDLDATDDPRHGHQEGRFFHGYYDCYCYLPLYVFSGRHLLAAKLRRSNIDASAGAVEEVARIIAQIRARWPVMRILLCADSGFAREGLMRWCELNGIDYCSAWPATRASPPRSPASWRRRANTAKGPAGPPLQHWVKSARAGRFFLARAASSPIPF